MMQRIKTSIFILILVSLCVVVIGCETPEGGSSIPWARPEPWEGEGTLGFPIE
ncbi:hypothetical protein ACFL1T_03495 [Chlamydiota bacterium]